PATTVIRSSFGASHLTSEEPAGTSVYLKCPPQTRPCRTKLVWFVAGNGLGGAGSIRGFGIVEVPIWTVKGRSSTIWMVNPALFPVRAIAVIVRPRLDIVGIWQRTPRVFPGPPFSISWRI